MDAEIVAPRKLKFLRIIGSADPRSGGPIEGFFQSAAVLTKLGHSCSLVTLDDPADPWVVSSPYPIVATGRRTSTSSYRRWLPWLRYGYNPRLIGWLKKHASDYDVVIVSGLWNYCALASRLALAGSTTPYFVFTHGMLDPWFRTSSPLKNLAKQMLWPFSEGPLLANACAVLFTSEEERNLARGSFWPYRVRERVVAYGTADNTHRIEKQKAAFAELFPSLSNKRFLLFLSRIHPKKGCDILLTAFAKIAAQNPEIDLVMAGPDQTGWKQILQQEATAHGIQNRIHWTGMLTGDVKWGAFHLCDAFVLPSHQENFGIVVAEAMACGKPVLITDKVNIWREVRNTGAGIVATDDAGGITSLLERYLQLDRNETTAMGKRARLAFLQHFDVAQAANDLVRLSEMKDQVDGSARRQS